MLRRSHISLLTELCVPVKIIIGHRDEKTTLQIYSQVAKKYGR